MPQRCTENSKGWALRKLCWSSLRSPAYWKTCPSTSTGCRRLNKELLILNFSPIINWVHHGIFLFLFVWGTVASDSERPNKSKMLSQWGLSPQTNPLPIHRYSWNLVLFLSQETGRRNGKTSYLSLPVSRIAPGKSMKPLFFLVGVHWNNDKRSASFHTNVV